MKISDIITLSDQNKYVVASIVNHKNKTYLCLVDINNNQNIKYCYLDKDEVVTINKESLSAILLLKMTNEILKFDFTKLKKED
jgi:hypothetical protein